MKTISAKILAIGLPLTAVAVTGGAVAFWSGSAGGSGGTTAETSVDALVLSTSAVTGLVPGGTVTVPVTATNNNATTSVSVSQLTAVDLVSDSDGCDDVSGATVAVTQPAQAVIVAPAGGTAQVGSIKITMANSPTVNQDACKGAVFTATLAAS